jgi:5'-3' exonuclease
MPDNLRAQVDEINEMVSLFQTSVVEIPNVEADDVIATLAEIYGKDKIIEFLFYQGIKIYIVWLQKIFIFMIQ